MTDDIQVCENPDCESEFEAGSATVGKSGREYAVNSEMNLVTRCSDECAKAEDDFDA